MYCVPFALLLFVSLCSGCTPVLQTEARKDHVLHSQFEIAGSMQTVIKNIRDKKAECRPFHVSENITVLEEFGEAHIEYRGEASHSGIIFLVDLHKQNDKTRVDIYYTTRIPGGERAFRTLEYGVQNLPGCP